MTSCVRSRPIRTMPAAIAASMTLALAACAGGVGVGVDTNADMPFRTSDVCTGSAIPDGWIRTNDWRGKGCGVEHEAGADDRRADVQLASAGAPPKAKAKTVDVSRGVNAVSSNGPNNWMTITEIDRVRVGRSLTACAGDLPQGWVEIARYWDKGRCGNPKKSSVKNVMLIERAK